MKKKPPQATYLEEISPMKCIKLQVMRDFVEKIGRNASIDKAKRSFGTFRSELIPMQQSLLLFQNTDEFFFEYHLPMLIT